MQGHVGVVGAVQQDMPNLVRESLVWAESSMSIRTKTDLHRGPMG